MNFVEYVEDLRRHLPSTTYMEMLWDSLQVTEYVTIATLEDEEVYNNHIPVDFSGFLKNCVSKLRAIKNDPNIEVDWDKLDVKYVSTLIYYTLDRDDESLEDSLYAADMFFLLNLLNKADKNFFFKTIYVTIMNMMQQFEKNQDLSKRIIVFLLDDIKICLSKRIIPDTVTLDTIALLSYYTLFTEEKFDHIDPDVSFENLGYIAFVGLQIMIDQLSQRDNKDKGLKPLLHSLMSSLSTSRVKNYRRNVVLTHQENVRLFVRQNYNKFVGPNFSALTYGLKMVCVNPDFDDYDGFACLTQELALNEYQTFNNFLIKVLAGEAQDQRKTVLKYIPSIMRHPSPFELREKQIIRCRILMHAMLNFLQNGQDPLKEDILRVISECSETPLGLVGLEKALKMPNTTLSACNISQALDKVIDKSWEKKALNISYIIFTCNLLISCRKLVALKFLNQFRAICISGSPFDLKSCIPLFKLVMEKCCGSNTAVLYTLSIFIKLMFHTQETSNKFAKELHDFIFSNITTEGENNFIWRIIECLVSGGFDLSKIFEKFGSLNLLSSHSIKILLENKIMGESRKIALKLLSTMLSYVDYHDTAILDNILEQWHTKIYPVEKDFDIILSALVKMLERKEVKDCTELEIQTYRRLQLIVYQALYNQMFPNKCVKHAIYLLKNYARLLGEGEQWSKDIFLRTENSLNTKLVSIWEMKAVDPVSLLKDVLYVSDFILIGGEILGEYNFTQLEQIVKVSEQPRECVEFLMKNQSIFLMCVLLYTNQCLVNSGLINECVKNFEALTKITDKDNNLTLRVLLGLYDICKTHLHYFEPLIPILFKTLLSNDAFLRFNAMHIAIDLINDQQLRLVDGQYYIFMTLLADDNKLIKQHMEIFISEKFVPIHNQVVARYFVPGIFHYNFYYDHYFLSLMEQDQQLLRKRPQSFEKRYVIYYHLFNDLPESIKFSIINEIAFEIFAKIHSQSLYPSPELYSVLEDALVVIMFTIPNHQILKKTKMFFTDGLEIIKDKLMAPQLPTETKPLKAYQLVLGAVLTNLFHLLYCETHRTPKICQNILFTIISLTNEFFDMIKHILNENESLKKMFLKLEEFFLKEQEQFAVYEVTVNPATFNSLSCKDSVEFFFHECESFVSIPESVVATYNP